jgi:hypothetical protein
MDASPEALNNLSEAFCDGTRALIPLGFSPVSWKSIKLSKLNHAE